MICLEPSKAIKVTVTAMRLIAGGVVTGLWCSDIGGIP